jgi:hypothetical protein
VTLYVLQRARPAHHKTYVLHVCVVCVAEGKALCVVCGVCVAEGKALCGVCGVCVAEGKASAPQDRLSLRRARQAFIVAQDRIHE